MKSNKLTTTVALATSLFAQVALADQPCGNYGISTTNPNPCAQQQQPVYVQQAPETVYVQPQQAPCGPQQTQVQTPAPVQQNPAPAYGYRPRYQARYQSNYAYQQPVYGARLQQRRQEAAAPDYGRGIDLGIRGSQDADTLDVGLGVYMRAHQKTGQQRLALELSGDALASGDLLAQGALMLYLNPNGFIKPFGLLGGGLALGIHEETIAQAGFGLDIELGQRTTVTGDIRAVEAINGSFECVDAECFETVSSGTSLLLGNIGISRKF